MSNVAAGSHAAAVAHTASTSIHLTSQYAIKAIFANFCDDELFMDAEKFIEFADRCPHLLNHASPEGVAAGPTLVSNALTKDDLQNALTKDAALGAFYRHCDSDHRLDFQRFMGVLFELCLLRYPGVDANSGFSYAKMLARNIFKMAGVDLTRTLTPPRRQATVTTLTPVDEVVSTPTRKPLSFATPPPHELEPKPTSPRACEEAPASQPHPDSARASHAAALAEVTSARDALASEKESLERRLRDAEDGLHAKTQELAAANERLTYAVAGASMSQQLEEKVHGLETELQASSRVVPAAATATAVRDVTEVGSQTMDAPATSTRSKAVGFSWRRSLLLSVMTALLAHWALLWDNGRVSRSATLNDFAHTLIRHPALTTIASMHPDSRCISVLGVPIGCLPESAAEDPTSVCICPTPHAAASDFFPVNETITDAQPHAAPQAFFPVRPSPCVTCGIEFVGT